MTVTGIIASLSLALLSHSPTAFRKMTKDQRARSTFKIIATSLLFQKMNSKRRKTKEMIIEMKPKPLTFLFVDLV